MPDAHDLKAAFGRHKWVCWFDRPTDTICMVNREKAKQIGKKDGQEFPEECVLRVPLKLGEIFIAAVMNAIEEETDGSAILQATKSIADAEAMAWLEFGTTIRREFQKRGAGIESVKGEVSVPASELARLRAAERFLREAPEPRTSEGQYLLSGLKEVLDGPGE